MKFFGTDQELVELKDSQENAIDALLMNVYNAGFVACNKTVDQLYNQAKEILSRAQELSEEDAQNPFIDIVKFYLSLEDQKRK